MSIRIKADKGNNNDLQLSPLKFWLKITLWGIFYFISVILIVKLFEIYINNNGIDAFLYLLIFLVSIALIPIFYRLLNRMFEADKKKEFDHFFGNIKEMFFMGDEHENHFKDMIYLDIDFVLSRKNLKIDKKIQKRDNSKWLKEERKLFRV
ncbi:MAG: hypothetical protein DRG27_04045 [Deltaproteobacteria bacterium]|nr:MAG: hypothetical protein DRG27_04045 [Deltaproteobacteria bacterium]